MDTTALDDLREAIALRQEDAVIATSVSLRRADRHRWRRQAIRDFVELPARPTRTAASPR